MPVVTGREVADAGSHSSAKFTPGREVVGATFTGVRRRAKYLLFGLDDGRELVAHLGMTGSFTTSDSPDAAAPHRRAWWLLAADQGHGATTLSFSDTRRFGRLRVVPAGDYSTIATLARAGPEPFDPTLDGELFWDLLRRSRQPIKTRLLSQRPIAGVGNIYADEALWLAQINPRATRLGRQRAASLLDALRAVLQQGIDLGGTTLRDYRNLEGGAGDNQYQLQAYGRGGNPCGRCGAALRTAPLGGRATTWCRICQSR